MNEFNKLFESIMNEVRLNPEHELNDMLSFIGPNIKLNVEQKGEYSATFRYKGNVINLTIYENSKLNPLKPYTGKIVIKNHEFKKPKVIEIVDISNKETLVNKIKHILNTVIK